MYDFYVYLVTLFFVIGYNRVPSDCPRLLINRELVGTVEESDYIGLLEKLGVHSDFDLGTAPHLFARGMNFKSDRNRDIAILGDCDDGVTKLANALGWGDDLRQLCKQATLSSETGGATTSK